MESPARPPLQHIAIIPDGNRRWAAAHGMQLWEGVRTGVQTAEAIFDALRRRRIPWCTFWASSYDNLTKRPATERAVLNELFAEWFTRLAANEAIHANRVRVRVLGEWKDVLAAPAARAIEHVLEATAGYNDLGLTFLVGYDGDRELAAAATSLVRERTGVQASERASVTIDDVRKHAWTRELPEVDVIVRTGSWEDPHRSANFLPLLTSNVQEAYPKVYWPAFSETDLAAIITDVTTRERRLGR